MIPILSYGLGIIKDLGGLDAAKAVAEELLHVVERRKTPDEAKAAIDEIKAKLVTDISAGNADFQKALHDKFDPGGAK